MIEGHSIYDPDVAELLKKLEAKGILLIVVDGKRNIQPIEFASALEAGILPRVVEVLNLVALAIQNDLMEIRRRNL